MGDSAGDASAVLAAVRARSPGALQRLIEAGGSARIKTESGDTPLALAAASGDLPVIALLLHAGADLDAQNAAGDTARVRNQARIDALDTAKRRRLSELGTLLETAR